MKMYLISIHFLKKEKTTNDEKKKDKRKSEL